MLDYDSQVLDSSLLRMATVSYVARPAVDPALDAVNELVTGSPMHRYDPAATQATSPRRSR